MRRPPAPSRRVAVTGASVAVAVALLTACRADTVRLGFRPVVGSQVAYDIKVTSSSVTRFEGQAAQDSDDAVNVRAEQRVLSADAKGARVEVSITRVGSTTGSAPVRFVVRLDRGAQLVAVERAAGLPTGVLGDIGLSEVLPAAGTTPERALALGQHWRRTTTVELPGSAPARLTTRGRLAEVGVHHGRAVATIESRATLPVTRTLTSPEGTLELDGTQTTTSGTTAVVADGTITHARSTTVARLALRLVPTNGNGADAVRGQLVLTVRSETNRIY